MMQEEQICRSLTILVKKITKTDSLCSCTGWQALLVSTAPFGDVVYKGRIFDLEGVQKDSFNHIVVPASSLIIKRAYVTMMNCQNGKTF